MTDYAKGSGIQFSIVKETTMGQTPDTPSWTILEILSESLALKRGSLRDNSINSSRNRRFHAYGNKHVPGDIRSNLIYSQLDALFESAMYNEWETAEDIGSTTSNTVVVTGKDVTSKYPVGRKIVLYNNTDDSYDGVFTVENVSFSTDTTITISETLPGTGGDGKIAAFVINGKTPVPLSAQRKQTSTASNLFNRFLGLLGNGFNLSVKPEAIIEVGFNMLGLDEELTEKASSSYSEPADLGINPMTSYSGVITEGGSVSAVISGLDLSLNNEGAPFYAIGNESPLDIAEGPWGLVSGSLSHYITDHTLYEKFKNGTESSLILKISDPNSGVVLDDTYYFILPRIKYVDATGGQIQQSGPLINNMPFEALSKGSGDDQYTLLIARIPKSDT